MEYIKYIGKNGKTITRKRIRREAIKVRCSHCGRERTTIANSRCRCFFCGRHFTFLGAR